MNPEPKFTEVIFLKNRCLSANFLALLFTKGNIGTPLIRCLPSVLRNPMLGPKKMAGRQKPYIISLLLIIVNPVKRGRRGF